VSVHVSRKVKEAENARPTRLGNDGYLCGLEDKTNRGETSCHGPVPDQAVWQGRKPPRDKDAAEVSRTHHNTSEHLYVTLTRDSIRAVSK
jgi:hypothetical protein